MASAFEVAQRARELYASGPDHAAACTPVASGAYCVMSALGQALTDLKVAHDPSVWLAVRNALKDAANFNGSLVAFNAQHSTEEVLQTFDEAIEHLKEPHA